MTRSKSLDYGARHKKRSVRAKLWIAIGIFAFVISVSSVYAAESGFLNFYGVTARTELVDIRFSNTVYADGGRVGEYITISSSTDYKILSISALLLGPGDSRTIQFTLDNVGNQAVRLLNISTDAETNGTGLTVQWPDQIVASPNLNNYVLIPGATSDTFLVIIGWDVNQLSVPTGVFRNFSLLLDYQNAALPAP